MVSAADTTRSPLCTLAHTNSHDSSAESRGTTAGKRPHRLQTRTSPPPASGPGFRLASDRRRSGEALRACEIAAAATLVQSHCRRRAAQRAAAKERRRVYRRQQIVREIHASELSYHSSLRVLDEHYMQQVMWKRAHTVAALPAMELASPAAPRTPVAAAATAAAAAATATTPGASARGAVKGTPIASSPMGTPGSQRGRSGKRRRGSIDSNLGGLTAKLAARAVAATSVDSRLDFPTAEEVDTMFCGGALMCLIDLSRQLTDQLDAVANGDHAGCCGTARKVGEIFAQLAPRFLIFSEYCKRTEGAMEAVTRCQDTYPTFGQFVSHLQSVPASPAAAGGDGAGGTLDLLSYLIMPVQRVPRYVMLLTELLDTIPSDDQTSRTMVAKALEVVRESAVQIDNAVGAEQRRIRLQQAMTSLRDAPASFDTDVAGRTLVREGRVQLIEKGQPAESSQLNVSIASLGSHFGLGTPKTTASAAVITPSRSIGGTPSRLSLGGTPNRRRSMLRRKSVCIEPDRRCYGNHLALLCNDVLLITKPFQNEFGHEKLRWVDCVWLNGASVDTKTVEHDDPSECGFYVQNKKTQETHTEEDHDRDEEQDSGHTLVTMDAASKAEWLSDLEAAIQTAPPPPPLAIEPASPSPRPNDGNDTERLGATIGTPLGLPHVEVSPLPTTPVRALKNALQRGRRASSGRRLRRSSLRRKSTTDAGADAAAAAAAASPVADEFRVSGDGSLMGDALPESDADAAALRDAMLEQLHALISLDMRKFLLESSCAGTLRDWAAVSDWAHDTGGGVEERRAERGVWLGLFATVQRDLAPQFGLDPETIVAPILDSPVCSSPSVLPVGQRADCSPVLESASELPALDFGAVGDGSDEDETGESGGLTLSLPPLASTPLSTRRPFARPSAGGACCAASAPASPGVAVATGEGKSLGADTAAAAAAATPVGPSDAAPTPTEPNANQTEATSVSESMPRADPAAAVMPALDAACAEAVSVTASAASSSPSPRGGTAVSPGGKPQQQRRRKRRTSSFACCAAPTSPQ